MDDKKKLKKNDLVLVIVVIAAAVLVYIVHTVIGGNSAGCVTIKIDGELQGVYSLLEDQEIVINEGTNILLIKDGKADMIEADCPDKLCVKQKAVSKNRENIICLPNKVIIEVDSSETSEYDAVTN